MDNVHTGCTAYMWTLKVTIMYDIIEYGGKFIRLVILFRNVVEVHYL